MPFTKSDIENIGHALSTVIQARYVWLFNHISRSLLFDLIDTKQYNVPQYYSFSKEDQEKGNKHVKIDFIIDLIRKSENTIAYSDNGSLFNYENIREVTITGLRATLLTNIQSYLEFYRILDIYKRNRLPEFTLFDFIRQARNIVCHSNGIMNSTRLHFCKWRHLVIDNNGQHLKMTDFLLLELVDEIIETLAKIYVGNGAEIDYVSLNLGYGIPYIQKYIQLHHK